MSQTGIPFHDIMEHQQHGAQCLPPNSHSGRTASLSSVLDKRVRMPSEDALALCFQYALAAFHTNPHLPVF